MEVYRSERRTYLTEYEKLETCEVQIREDLYDLPETGKLNVN